MAWDCVEDFRNGKILLIFLIFTLCNVDRNNATQISSITPTKGSLNGGTRITIDGSGFSKDNFNEGNAVQMVSSTKSYKCEVHKDGTTQDQIMCYTVPMPDDEYYVRVTVDGTAVPVQNHCRSATDSRCRFTPSWSHTPTITSISPVAGPPGFILTLNGKIFTDRYGSNIAESSNGRTEQILRVYAAGRECLLKKELDVFYGIQLNNNGASDNGYMKCKLQGTFVGNNNVSILIDGHFGRTTPASDTLHVYSNDQIAMFQTYAVINETSPSTGSLLGGQLLTITGSHFDETRSKAKVYVDGEECVIKGNITDNNIVCETPALPQGSADSYKGNRGLILEFWNETSKSMSNLADVLSFDNTASDYSLSFAEEANFKEGVWNSYVSRMRGYFVPPHTGEYSFYVKADDGAILYMSPDSNKANRVEIARCKQYTTSYTRWTEQGSSKRSLVKGNSYYMEVVHLEGRVDAFATVAARFYGTTFTNATTKKATQETQRIQVQSQVKRENQEIHLENWNQQSAINEIQRVIIDDTSGGYSGATFQLGLYGVYTESFEHKNGDPQDSAISTALKSLPVFVEGESVGVTVQSLSSGSGYTYTFTFTSERGDIPDLEYITLNGSSLNISVTEQRKGVPSGKVFIINMNGIPSPPISYDTSASNVKTALMSLFGTRCPKQITNPTASKGHYNFESGCSVCGDLRGSRVTDVEAFCGKGSILNPTYLYKNDNNGLELNQKMKTVCFAYKGHLNNNFWVKYSYVDQDGEDKTGTVTVNADFSVRDRWHYNCFDILTPVSTAQPLGSVFTLNSVQISRRGSKVYFDEIYLGRDVVLSNTDNLDSRRLGPVMPNGVMIDSVTVTKIQTGVAYNITLFPLNCGNNIPKLQGESGQIPSSGSIRVQRNTEASPPVGGDFSITFKGKVKSGILFNVTGDELKDKLETVPEFGDIYAYRHGDCVNFDLYITFLSLAGNQDLIQVEGSRLTGVGVTVAVTTKNDGSLWYDPIPGDMLRTVNDKPQVMVVINDVPTRCTGNCDYEWTIGSTPTVTSVTPSSGSYNTEVTISGTGFDGVPSANKVVIGGAECTVKTASSNSIVCDAGDGPLGSYTVEVTVDSKGKAQHNGGSNTFTYTSQITSISPVSGALGGGIVLTLAGHGFTSQDVVTIGGKSCGVTTRSSSEINCIVPASTTADIGQGVSVDQNVKQLTFSGTFTYSSAASATITSFTPTTSSIKGGSALTITGSGFGSAGVLKIGGVEVNTTSFTNTQVTAVLPPMSPGVHSLQLLIGNNGAAVDGSGNVPSIDYNFKVTNVYPLQGSIFGGTRVTVTGIGFSTNKSDTKIKIGRHLCDVESATANQIICLVADTATSHNVDNMGTHYAFGEGYAWNPANVFVTAGDIVRWNWSYPSWVGGMNPRVEQTVSDVSEDPEENGFSSGETGTPSGVFMHRFTVPGTYYYWSGWIEPYKTTHFRGSVHVSSESSYSGEVSVKVGEVEALYDVNSGVGNPSSVGGCEGSDYTLDGCTDVKPAGNNSNKFNFAFWTCSSPKITSLSLNSGTTSDEISLNGNGFSTTKCQNEIKFGPARCVPSSASKSRVVCSVDTANEPEIGVQHDLSVRVGNIGNAVIYISGQYPRTFGITPQISGISPSRGSLSGGTDITVTGSGYSGTAGDVSVDVGGYNCPVVSKTYTQIICKSQVLSAGVKTVSVKVNANGNNIHATCTNAPCEFIYDSEVTPTAARISPSTLTGAATTLTITGTKFGEQISQVVANVGGQACSITSVSNTQIECSITNAPVGATQPVNVFIKGKGKATGTLTVNSQAIATSVTPSEGSKHGKTLLTILGNGFTNGSTSVDIGGRPCTLSGVSLSEITCLSPSNSLGDATLTVTSNGITYPTLTFKYSSAATPVVSSVAPSVGSSGATLVITGQNFASTNNENNVTINGVECVVTSASTTSIQCTTGAVGVGTYPVLVETQDKGLSNNDQTFQYELRTDSISPNRGSTGGKQTVTLTGSGFDETIQVSVCGQTCNKANGASQTASQYICETPQAIGVVSTQACDILTTVNGLSKTLVSGYTYDASITPEITNVNPARGGTGGGTQITITGTGFGTNPSDVAVTIAGTVCTVNSVTNTKIICQTGQHSPSVKTNVHVNVAGNGIAKQTSAMYHYVDVWSSPYTWGGSPLPTDGDLVVIEAGQSILLDTDTAQLLMLLIRGGELIFDEKDLELKATNILVTDGGKLQVGTEEKPFQHNAVITLYGHHRSKELPIYGTKSLAVREGTLDLHGIPVPMTWTRLDTTASRSSSTLNLQDPVTWQVGDEIVIASTGHHQSQSQNEKRTITGISGGNRTLTISPALDHDHIALTETINGRLLEYRAEVGLLSHNVKVRGYRDPQWDELIEACPDGFNTGEFAVQTCFLGRFGEEMGSDQFGGIIFLHTVEPDRHLTTARIEHIEVTHAGQAFRLGRYPIHFHLMGDMSTSYVRGCSVHNAFNRAINVHGTHNALIERNVIYNIMGGAMFLEDGIETGNIFQYNLGVFVRESSSLLNDDVTPATFWVTNPNNTIQHNAAAGGSHFGFWYRMHHNPQGPSRTSSVCPQQTPLGVFNNNTAHSFGWFGLWIFETFIPRTRGDCSSGTPYPARFYNLFTWNCEKGAEAVNSGALQFHDFVLVNNVLAGYEGKALVEGEYYTENGPMVKDALIVAHSSVLPKPGGGCTTTGIVLPFGFGFLVNGTDFVNFDTGRCAAFAWTRIAGRTADQNGGFHYKTQRLTFNNSPNKVRYAWEFEGIVEDLDASLIGITNGKVVPTTGTLPSTCTVDSGLSVGFSGSKCPSDVKFHRFSFNNIHPSALDYKNVIFTNRFGNSSLPWQKKRFTHPKGWMGCLVSGEEYSMEFENANHLTNISFSGTFYMFDENGGNTPDHIIMTQSVAYKPDRFMIDSRGNLNASSSLDPDLDYNGDWQYDSTTSKIKYLVSAQRSSNSGRRKRSTGSTTNLSFKFSAYRCYFKDCIPPPDPNTIPPPNIRPDNVEYWSNVSSWTRAPDGWGGNYGNNTYGLPLDGDDVMIVEDQWLVADTTLPRMHKLVIYGALELDHGNITQTGSYRDFTINVTYLMILGGRLIIGWEDKPFLGNVLILLNGNHATPTYPLSSGPAIGSKAIGVFGMLDLHGKPVNVTWTKLSQTANIGDNRITLAESVDWSVGDDIVIAPTGFNAWETETFRIIAVSNNVLTLNDTLQYKHIVNTETHNSLTIHMAAEVGLLTRNIKIQGADYNDLYKESFGGRVVVGITRENGNRYIGAARISNVEFYLTGQEGWVESYDARYSVAFIDAGVVSAIKPSYVKKCSFHHGFSPAIGVYGLNGLPIEDNVIHHTVWFGIETTSDNTQIRRNYLTLMVFEGSYQDRFEPLNVRYNGFINADKATNLVLENNVVAGSERAGYKVPLKSCGSRASGDAYVGNTVHSSLLGIVVLPSDPVTGSCIEIVNFEVWKVPDYAIYYQNGPSVIVEHNKVADSAVGVFTMINGPVALAHQYADKTITVRNMLVIGRSASFDCTTDVLNTRDDAVIISANSRSFDGGRHIGVGWSTFSSGSNNAPEKPFGGIKKYQAIKGLMMLDNTTFAHFGTKCPNKVDYAIATIKSNDDGIHPLHSTGLSFSSVNNNNRVLIHRPNVGKINSADCVDMDCDGLKKALIRDEDGSLLTSGNPGAVIPQSEFQWNGDSRRGLGDYRIPKEMLTSLNGTRIPYNTLAPNKGIIRDSSCTYNSAWQAYECHNLNYRVLVIESLDSDTETRRLSPVAILGDGYIDLINGPQDHGWCSGYTCRKRLSTFMAVVATEKNYLMHFTSTTAQKLRYFLLNSQPTEAVRMEVWYSQPFRLDVYHDGSFVMPTNGRFYKDRYLLDPPPQGNPDYHKPNVLTDPAGTNWFDRDAGILFFVVKGPKPITVETVQEVIVSFQFPSMTVDEFYGEQMVQYLAAFLNVPMSKVRVVEIVSASSQTSGRRRKRSVSDDVVVVAISDPPNNSSNSSAPDSLTNQELEEISSKIVNEVQLGNMSDVLNNTVTGVSIAEPPADPSSQEWANQPNNAPYTVIVPAHSMRFNPAPTPLHENVAFSTQPKIQVLDEQGRVITNLGTAGSPWMITASLREGTGSNPSAILEGNLTVQFVNGWANFSNLLITQFGSGYIIDFNVTSPTEGENFTISTNPLTIPSRPIKASIVNMPNDIIVGNFHTFTLELQDGLSSLVLPDIAWRGHTWNVAAELGMPSLYNNVTFSGGSQVTFDTVTSRVSFYSITLSQLGMYVIKFHITSSPPDYDFYEEVVVTVKSTEQASMVIEETTSMTVKFDADYNTVVGSDDKYFGAMVGNYYANLYPEILFSSVTVSQGSIVVTFTISGNSTNINSTVYAVCSGIQSGTSFTYNGAALSLTSYMTVGGISYYGVTCGYIATTTTAPPSDSVLSVAVIVAVTLVSVAVIVAIVVIVIWRCNTHPHAKVNINHNQYYGQQNIEDALFRDKTFMSIRDKADKPLPPTSTMFAGSINENGHPSTPKNQRRTINDEKRALTPSSLIVSAPSPTPSEIATIKSQKKRGMNKQYDIFPLPDNRISPSPTPDALYGSDVNSKTTTLAPPNNIRSPSPLLKEQTNDSLYELPEDIPRTPSPSPDILYAKKKQNGKVSEANDDVPPPFIYM